MVDTNVTCRQRIAAGLCAKCAQPRNEYATLCDDCTKKWRVHIREQRGLQPWRPGGVGRPPKPRQKSLEDARIVVAQAEAMLAEGKTLSECAKQLGIHCQTLYRWRKREAANA